MKTLTQRKIAEKSGVSEAFVSLILSGERRPSWDVAKKLARATRTGVALWMEGPADRIRERIFKD